MCNYRISAQVGTRFEVFGESQHTLRRERERVLRFLFLLFLSLFCFLFFFVLRCGDTRKKSIRRNSGASRYSTPQTQQRGCFSLFPMVVVVVDCLFVSCTAVWRKMMLFETRRHFHTAVRMLAVVVVITRLPHARYRVFSHEDSVHVYMCMRPQGGGGGTEREDKEEKKRALFLEQ